MKYEDWAKEQSDPFFMELAEYVLSLETFAGWLWYPKGSRSIPELKQRTETKAVYFARVEEFEIDIKPLGEDADYPMSSDGGRFRVPNEFLAL